MINYNNEIIYALNNALIKIKLYDQCCDVYHLNESNDWINVAQIYIKEINDANRN